MIFEKVILNTEKKVEMGQYFINMTEQQSGARRTTSYEVSSNIQSMGDDSETFKNFRKIDRLNVNENLEVDDKCAKGSQHLE